MPGIKIDSIEISPSLVIAGSSNLVITSGPYKYTGNFARNDLMHFMACCSEALKYFGAAYGITKTEDGVTRRVPR